MIKVFWPELARNIDDKATAATLGSRESRNVEVVGKIRWFVVIIEGRNACTCLYVQTLNRARH